MIWLRFDARAQDFHFFFYSFAAKSYIEYELYLQYIYLIIFIMIYPHGSAVTLPLYDIKLYHWCLRSVKFKDETKNFNESSTSTACV